MNIQTDTTTPDNIKLCPHPDRARKAVASHLRRLTNANRDFPTELYGTLESKSNCPGCGRRTTCIIRTRTILWDNEADINDA